MKARAEETAVAAAGAVRVAGVVGAGGAAGVGPGAGTGRARKGSLVVGGPLPRVHPGGLRPKGGPLHGQGGQSQAEGRV